jgi:two-component system chemotaxis sensor kinase CheA
MPAVSSGGEISRVMLAIKAAMSGKDEIGTVHLKATHNESHVIIEISDDGMGINFDSVLNQAEKMGIIEKGDHSNLTLDDIIDLIFNPGFSTKTEISEISGRGFGMDIVQSTIEKFHGTIDVKTEPGLGTKFRIKLPVTLAMMQILIVKAENELFGIPLISVAETMNVWKDAVECEPDFCFFKLRNEAVRLIDIRKLLRMDISRDELSEPFKVVITNYMDGKIGIIVDGFKGKYEVVLKSFGMVPGRVKGVLGASILGDGTLVPILELSALLRSHLEGAQ